VIGTALRTLKDRRRWNAKAAMTAKGRIKAFLRTLRTLRSTLFVAGTD